MLHTASARLRPTFEVELDRMSLSGGRRRAESERPEEFSAAVLLRRNRTGRLEWCLPKGHIEGAETLPQTAAREVAEETGVVLSLEDLGLWDAWTTPEFEPRRYRTWFFVADLPEGQRTRAISATSLTGLLKKSSAPASRPRTRSVASVVGSAVKATPERSEAIICCTTTAIAGCPAARRSTRLQRT